MRGAPDLKRRTAGVLLHPTSLPGRHGIGDFGASARRFIDFLSDAGQSWWQMLPLGPPGAGHSPYQVLSAFGGSPLLVSLDRLVEDGLLPGAAVERPLGARARVEPQTVAAAKLSLLARAFAVFRHVPSHPYHGPFTRFKNEHRAWLEDYALFSALRDARRGEAWFTWEAPLRDREPAALQAARETLAVEVERHAFFQFLFFRQWGELKAYAHEKGVGLFGDVPIFVAHDSADVWAHPEIFKLDRSGKLQISSGVPPDYFSRSGQKWGNPVYRWDALKPKRYGWWIDRLRMSFEIFDAVRLDHFIGFERAWEVPGKAPDARRGRWVKGPGADFFNEVFARLPHGQLVAEDLGSVTPEVEALRDRFGLPGMRLLQFSFGPGKRDMRPHTFPQNCVAYTGTHDNNTIVGWFDEVRGRHSARSRDAARRERREALDYVGGDGTEMHWDMIRLCLMSPANLAILPAQDLLGLGAEARMNTPGTFHGNWSWRMAPGALDRGIARRLRRLTRLYGRVEGRG